MAPRKNSSFELVPFAILAANKKASIASDCFIRVTCQKVRVNVFTESAHHLHPEQKAVVQGCFTTPKVC